MQQSLSSAAASKITTRLRAQRLRTRRTNTTFCVCISNLSPSIRAPLVHTKPLRGQSGRKQSHRVQGMASAGVPPGTLAWCSVENSTGDARTTLTPSGSRFTLLIDNSGAHQRTLTPPTVGDHGENWIPNLPFRSIEDEGWQAKGRYPHHDGGV